MELLTSTYQAGEYRDWFKAIERCSRLGFNNVWLYMGDYIWDKHGAFRRLRAKLRNEYYAQQRGV